MNDKKTIYQQLGYSIRKRGNDEIEIHAGTFDGYVRGLIRTIILGCLLLGAIMDSSRGLTPFQYEIEGIKEDWEWAFNPDEQIKPFYDQYLKIRLEDDFLKMFPNEKKVSYQNFKADYKSDIRKAKLFICFYILISILFVVLFFLPRPRGLRINRKKRLIYWQTFGNWHSIAYVPKEGDPLSGLVYDKFGAYAFGWGIHFALTLHLWDLASNSQTISHFGIYPTPSSKHNADLLRAIRAYLQEDNPEFLNYIGKRYKTPWFRPLLFFCNMGALFEIRFKRKKADIALNKALRLWKKKSRAEKTQWFTCLRTAQQDTNQWLAKQGFENRVE